MLLIVIYEDESLSKGMFCEWQERDNLQKDAGPTWPHVFSR